MLKNYLRVAIRTLNNNRSYSLINILGLAIGIASFLFTSIYVKDQLGYDRFHEDAEDVYRLTITRTTESTSGNEAKWAISHVPLGPLMDDVYPEIVNHGRISRFSNGGSMVLVEEQNFTEHDIFYADASIIQMFGYQAVSGNPRVALSKLNSCVVTARMANKLFGNNDPLGQVIRVNDLSLEVGAVLQDYKDRSHFGYEILVSYPTYLANREEDSIINEWRWSQCWNYLQLAPETDPALIESDFTRFTEASIPQWTKGRERILDLQPLPDIHLHSNIAYEIRANANIAYVYMIGAIGLFILTLAVVNYMNLATARSMKRAKEIGVRKAMGSNRLPLVAQFMIESILIVAFSMVAAILLMEVTLPLFREVIGRSISLNLFSFETISSILLFVLTLGGITGIYPAFYLSSFPALQTLRGNRSTGKGSSLFRKGLVVFQFSVTAILLLSTLVVNDQLKFMLNQDVGFEIDQVLVLHDNINQEHILPKLDLISERLESTSGVKAVSYCSSLPTGSIFENAVHYEVNGEMEVSSIKTLWTDYNYLKSMGLSLQSGRYFDPNIISDLSKSFIINQAFAEEMGWQDAIGKRMRFGRNPDQTFRYDGTVIGVVNDFNLGSAHTRIEPLVIMMGDEPWGYLIANVSTSNIHQTLEDIKTSWSEVFTGVPLDPVFLDTHFNQQYKAEDSLLKLISILSLISVFIACLGLFGLASYLTEQRTKEIGIRKVIGASVNQLIVLLSIDFLRLIGLALIVGFPIGYLLIDDWLNDFAYRIDIGLISILLSGVIALSIGFLSVGSKAYRAAISDPVKALKYE